jgi:hypothetical protein
MAGPLGVLPACPAAATTEVETSSMAGPLGVLSIGPGAPTIEVKDVDGAPPLGGDASMSGSGHYQS